MDLCRAIRQFKPDIVHSNTVRAHLISLIAARLCRVKVVWTIRDATFPVRLHRLLADRVDRVICVSRAMAETYPLARHPERLKIVLNGIIRPSVDSGVERARIRSEFGIPEDSPVITTVGILTASKGQEHFLEAARLIKRRIPQTHFMVVGGEPDEAYAAKLKEMAACPELEGSVSFTGFRRDALSFLCASDVVVQPSVEPEGFGRVHVEALSVGTPLVSSPYGGPSEIIEDGVSGLLVPPLPVEPMADAVVKVLMNSDLARRLAEGGRKRFDECFDQDRETQAVQDVYVDLLKAARRKV
jgi:glycosyltransferase involved in cell wall biosynthesis